MKIQLLSAVGKLFFSCLFFCLFIESTTFAQAPQTTISDYVIFGGTATVLPGQTAPPSPGYGVQIASFCFFNQGTIQGTVGSYKLVKTTGDVTINGNIYSGGTIQLANSNEVKGNLAAGISPTGVPGTVVSIG